MTVTDFGRNAHHGLSAIVQNWFSQFRMERVKRAKYNHVYDELMRLTDRDLSDIGIARSDVADIARRAAYLSL